MRDFPPIRPRRNLLRLPAFLTVNQPNSKKGPSLKRENSLQRGSKFFPFKVYPFSDWRKPHFDRAVSFENVLILHKLHVSPWLLQFYSHNVLIFFLLLEGVMLWVLAGMLLMNTHIFILDLFTIDFVEIQNKTKHKKTTTKKIKQKKKKNKTKQNKKQKTKNLKWGLRTLEFWHSSTTCLNNVDPVFYYTI